MLKKTNLIPRMAPGGRIDLYTEDGQLIANTNDVFISQEFRGLGEIKASFAQISPETGEPLIIEGEPDA